MKNYILSLALCFITFTSFSQETYIVNGTSYELKTEVTGTIDLLWNIIDGKYRYFAKKGDAIVELTNTKDSNKKYKEEYKTILEGITPEASSSASKVKLTLESLRDYIEAYNASVDPDYITSTNAKLLTRFSVIGGVTNSPFVNNPDNVSNPVFGAEFEFSEAISLPRHSIYFQGKQVVATDKFDYSATQFIVGYRFRIINKEAFNFYASLDLAQYVFTKTEGVIVNNQDQFEMGHIKENGFEAPFTFGVGADIKLSETSFLSITYNELFALLLENEGNFSTSFAIGYKFKL
ncbi:MAG: hypothetical protein KDC81_01685 [Flavobacteriaceae bacterium]|nr:hypothetical protein [Flavobacteriaceae bacterium]